MFLIELQKRYRKENVFRGMIHIEIQEICMLQISQPILHLPVSIVKSENWEPHLDNSP